LRTLLGVAGGVAGNAASTQAPLAGNTRSAVTCGPAAKLPALLTMLKATTREVLALLSRQDDLS